ncbi:MAG: DUF2244 domain-containing protein [Paracoccaceae bacterium]
MPYDIREDIEDTQIKIIEVWPYNSLKPKGFVLFLGSTFVLISLPLFNVLGTTVFWGLLPFLLVAFIGVWFALRRSLNDRQVLEQLTLSQEEVALIRQDPTGEHKRWVCSPYWAKLKIYKTEGPVRNYITLTGNGREVELGAFLTEDERKTLYEELEQLLDRYKAINTN